MRIDRCDVGLVSNIGVYPDACFLLLLVFLAFIFHKVATQLRRGGIFSNPFIANFSQSATLKQLLKSVNIWRRYGQSWL